MIWWADCIGHFVNGILWVLFEKVGCMASYSVCAVSVLEYCTGQAAKKCASNRAALYRFGRLSLKFTGPVRALLDRPVIIGHKLLYISILL